MQLSKLKRQQNARYIKFQIEFSNAAACILLHRWRFERILRALSFVSHVTHLVRVSIVNEGKNIEAEQHVVYIRWSETKENFQHRQNAC